MNDLRDTLVAALIAGKPFGHRILHMGDRSSSVLTDTVEIEKTEWAPFKLIGSRLTDNWDEWQRAVDAAQADVLVVSNYRNVYKDPSRTEFVPPEEVVRWTEAHAKVPVVGINGAFVEDGGMLAVGASGFEQGDTVARMTIRILDARVTPADMPVQYPRQFMIYMHRGLLEKRQVALPRLQESFARATNNYLD
jgi:ABC-type uncharacterized transport system substrate-binding protein